MATLTADVTMVGGTSALARAIAAAVRPALVAGADRMAEEAKDNIVSEVEARYNTGREGWRRRGGPKLNDRGAYLSEVSPFGDSDVVCRFTIVGDEQFRVKFWSLNDGSVEHDMVAHGPGPMVWPSPEANTRANAASWGHSHPGTAGTHFYEAGLDRAIAGFTV